MADIPEGYEPIDMTAAAAPPGYEPWVPPGYEPVSMEAEAPAPGAYAQAAWQSAQQAIPALASVPARYAEMATDIVQPYSQAVTGALGVPELDPVKMLGEQARASRQRFDVTTQALAPDTAGMGDIMTGVVQAPRSLVQTAAAIPAAIAMKSPAPLLATMGAVTGGEAYGEAKEAGVPLTQRLTHAGSQAAVEVGTEMIGIPSFMKTLTAKTGLLKHARDFLGKELVGEELATVLQDLNDWATLNPEKPFSEYVEARPSAALQTLGGVLAGSSAQAGLAAGVNKGLQKAEELAKARMAVEERLSTGVMENYNREQSVLTPENVPGDAMVLPPDYVAAMPPSGAELTPFDAHINPHSDIPDTPLSPEELDLASSQEEELLTGVSRIPENPEGIADLGNLTDALDNPDLGVTPELEMQVQARVEELVARNPALGDVEPITGKSKAERIARNEFPNSLPADQRKVTWSAVPGEAGMTPRQLPPQQPGTVRVLGGVADEFAPTYRKALGETVQQWVKTYMPPGARVILNLSSLSQGKAGAYQLLSNGTHVITPQAIVRAQEAEEAGTLVRFNTFAQSQTYGGLTHEFGHAVLMSQFAQGMPAEYRNIVTDLDKNGFFSEEQIAQMPEVQGAVVREFQERKLRVLRGQMPATELVQTWQGPWKVGSDLMKFKNLQSLYVLARRVLQNAGVQLTGKADELKRVNGAPVTALELVHALGRSSGMTPNQAEAYYLSFNEYMAEQFSRYAHVKKIDQGTALGRYFAMALETLRKFFRFMKAEGFIQPGTSFTAWVDNLMVNRALAETVPVKEVKGKKKAAKAKTPEQEIKEIQTLNEDKPTTLDRLAANPAWWAEVEERIGNLYAPGPARRKLLERAKTVTTEVELRELLDEYELSQPKFEVKEKGGAWSLAAVNDLARPMYKKLAMPLPYNYESMSDEASAAYDKQTGEMWSFTNRLSANYLNKYAGTKEDPLKDVLISNGAYSWGATMDELIESEQDSWRLNPAYTYTMKALTDYLEHAADYLIANVPQEKWENYDLTRLVKETAKWDAEQQARAAKARAASMLGMPVYREYPDGFKWVQLTRPGEFAQESDIMGHSVRGYEPTEELRKLPGYPGDGQGDNGNPQYGLQGWQGIQSGEARVYSLRDPQGVSHVTIEVDARKENPEIRQMKGKGNQAISEQYQPYTHDFVQKAEVPWGYVRDLALADLADVQEDMRVPDSLRDTLKAQIPSGMRFIPETEFTSLLDPMLLERRDDILQYFREGKGYVVYRGTVLEKVLNLLSSDTVNDEYRRLAKTSLDGMARDADYGLRFDALDETGQVDKANAEAATQALKNVGFSPKDSLWAAKAINFASNLKYWLLQVQQLAHTDPDPGLQHFVLVQRDLYTLKDKMIVDGAKIAERWENLTAESADKLERLLRDEEASGGHVTELQQVNGRWTHVGGEALIDYLKQRGIDGTKGEGEKIAQLFVDYKNSILYHIDVRESGAIQLLKKRYDSSPALLQREVAKVRAAAAQWRNAPYVPRSRFGEFIVKVWARDPETGYKTLIHREHFESAAERNVALGKFQKVYGSENVEASKIDAEMALQLSLPREFLMTLKDSGAFSDGQLETIGEAMQPVTTDKLFKTFQRDAEKVSGYSQDMLRNYSNWIEDSANATSKYVYGREMTQAVAWTRQESLDAQREGRLEDFKRLERTADMMNRARGYIMHPEAEFFRIRSAIALFYLLWAPKTALMNLTGMLQTVSALTGEFGDKQGMQAYAKAMKDMMQAQLSPEDKKQALTPDDQWALGRAENEGSINQGYAYFLAGVANAGNLARRIRKTTAGRAQRAFLEYGMKPFTAVEMLNRRATFLPLFRLELQRNLVQGMPPKQAREEAYTVATSKTKLLQGDYAAGSKPRIFQGKYASLLTIFYSFMQYMLWIMSGGYERGLRKEAAARGETPRSILTGMTIRMWAMYLMLAGASGVPFGETIMAFMQYLWEKFGGGGGKSLKEETQRMLKDTFGIHSLYWRRALTEGLLHDLGGVNLSGSMSLGTPLPGLRTLSGLGAPPKNARELIGGAAMELTGPFGGVVQGAAELATAQEIGAKELAGAIPGQAGALFRAYDAWKTGMTDKKGALMLRGAPEPGYPQGKPRRATPEEIALTAASFSLTELADKRNFERIVKDKVEYWNERRVGLMRDYLEAYKSGDRQLVGDVRAAVLEYNAESPPELRLSGSEISSHVKTNLKGIQKVERGIPARRELPTARETWETLNTP